MAFCFLFDDLGKENDNTTRVEFHHCFVGTLVIWDGFVLDTQSSSLPGHPRRLVGLLLAQQ